MNGRGARFALWVAFSFFAVIASLHAAYRLHALYLAPNGLSDRSAGAAAFGVLLALAGASFSDRRGGDPGERLPRVLAFASLGASLFAVLPFLAFATPTFCALVPAFGVFACTLAGVWALRDGASAIGRTGLAANLLEYCVHPLGAFAALSLSVAASAFAAHVGFLRTGALIAAALAISASLAPSLLVRVGAARRARGAFALPVIAACAACAVAATAEHLVRIREVSAFPEEIVHAVDGAAHRYVVAAAPGGYELFSDSELLVATLDEGRFERALVRPALSLETATELRVLLLPGGSGVVEREILADPRVQRLTVVAEDGELGATCRGMRWLERRVAQDSARVETVVAEPIAFLRRSPERYDVIVADLPPPLGYRAGKYYTRYFFSLLSDHTADGGLLVVPATSAFEAKGAFESTLATLTAAGLRTRAYHAAVPTLGLTTFVVASKRTLPAGDAAFSAIFEDRGSDLDAAGTGASSTLHDQRTVAEFSARDDGSPRE